ncbi:hypothetical protein G3T14_21725 [Methylobacterium sp. BTF04]|uniref:hypothetical protein n=1 Tax=Methylobacterium sp. BTF04 TaxID=2708300 RepID=UPI0013D8C966|nr:hypothetical protein [Methylobacterium sp. BTF04]NEU14702.1 hypothetical protein [Methylobacterium sp. BTF04]
MSESKQRHLPPNGMMNASGRHVTDLARGVMELLEKPFDEGLQADVAAHVLVASAVDLWRANYGDAQVTDALKKAIDRRMEKPLEYWGGERGR